MPLIEIRAVELADDESRRLWGCYIDQPAPGGIFDGGVVDTWGWVLGRTSPTVAVEFLEGGRLLRRVPVNVRRADLLAAFPGVPTADRSGFRTVIPIEGRDAEFRIEVHAVLKDKSRVLVGTLVARRRWRESISGPGAGLVSIIIPCYNLSQYLGEAVESALAQTYPHIEVVVVDDGSSDNTEEVAARYPGVRYVRQNNQGLPAAARNTGLRRGNGDYLIFLDADDRLTPVAVAAGLGSLHAHPEAAFASGRYRWIALDGSSLPTPDRGDVVGDRYAALLRSNYLGLPATVMYRRGVFEAARGFDLDPALRAAEDYELNLRITRRFPVCEHDAVVAEYRQRGGSLSRDPALMLQSVLTVLRAQRPYLGKNREHWAAYRTGIRFWTRYYGRPLAHEAVGLAQRREWRRLLRATWVLMRCYPVGLASALVGSASLE